MTEIRTFQFQVRDWTHHNFPNDIGPDVVLGTNEEAGEAVEAVLMLLASLGRLSRASLKMQQGIRGTPQEWLEEIRKETADVFIKLCHIASAYHFDLHTVIEQRWAVVQQRDFVADPKGHGLPT